MHRPLDAKTLDAMAGVLASQWLAPNRRSRTVEGLYVGGPEYVLQEMYKYTFKDEHEYILAKLKAMLGTGPLKDFEDAAKQRFSPRDDKVFHQLLADKLAIDPDGKHISGKIGSTVRHGQRLVGARMIEVETRDSMAYRRLAGLGKEHRQTYWRSAPLYWPIYAGEPEERAAGSLKSVGGVADDLPPTAVPPGMKFNPALNTRISNECAILACDAVVDNLDEGTGAAIVRGYSGTQPADPDTAATGTLLHTNVCDDPAFGNAADAAPGAIATAGAIADDTSADATGTVGYVRASSTNDGATPLDDHIDGEAGASGADFNYNTTAIVTGGTVSMGPWTVTMPES